MANQSPSETTHLTSAMTERRVSSDSLDSRKLLISDFPKDEKPREPWYKAHLRECLAEAFAMMVFVLVGTLSVVTGTPIGVAVAHGFTIAILVAGLGPISGCHMNPAVTLAVVLAGGCTPVQGFLYFLSQLLGAVVGAGWARITLSYVPVDALANPHNLTQFALIGGAAHTLPAGVPPGLALLAEIGLTMMLVTTILMTAVNTDANDVIYPLCIGFAVVVGILAGMDISGASMNPARSFGPAVLMIGVRNVWVNHWVYWVGPAIGACIAVLFFRLAFARPDKRLFFKTE